jgi:transcriptional regulator with XRE-family HTH domain
VNLLRINRVKFIAEMARQDLTVLDLAKNCCLSRATITGVRSGKSCTQETAAKLAQGLGVPLESILEKEA